MKQLVLRKGRPQVVEAPAPAPSPGSVLVANASSAISSGTERSAVAASSGSLATRALHNPNLVRQTLRHAREHGLRETVEVVREGADADLALGYSSAGTVLDTGGLPDFRVGQRVACAGAGRANHAEVVSVPSLLAREVPEGMSLRDAGFAAIGAIALQGVRRAAPTLGERVVVVGLGLVGLLTVQVLRAAGCRVVGVEPLERRRELGVELGAELALGPDEALAAVAEWSDGTGADAVLVTAAAAGDGILNQAVLLSRRKGRVVPVGDIGLAIEREPLYEREADVLISTSYGPGRYDPAYEDAGIDYPLSYVRWTAGRNMDEFLRLVASGAVRVEPLVELELPLERAPEAYDALASDSPPLAAVLTYPERSHAATTAARASRPISGVGDSDVRVALVGAGSFARSMHAPNLKRSQGVHVETVVSLSGSSAAALARSLNGAKPSSDWREAVEDPGIDLVLVATRHDTHAEIASAALRAGRAVLLEKPLGLTREEIDDVWAAGAQNDRFAIGFNRPFAELAQALAEEVRAAPGPIQLSYRVNAPAPAGHWLNDPEQGGGRILGEACHMFDFANWLCGPPERVWAAGLTAPRGVGSTESATVTIRYANGSLATLHYTGHGPDSLPKERIEVVRGGRAWVLDDFTRLSSFGPEGESVRKSKGDKGHAALLGRALAACRGEVSFEPGLGAAYVAQSVALAALESISSEAPVEVAAPPARGAA